MNEKIFNPWSFLFFLTTILLIAIGGLTYFSAIGNVAAGIALGAVVMLLVVVIVFGLFLAQQLLNQRHQERAFQANQTENVSMLEQSQKAMNQQLLGMTRLQTLDHRQPEAAAGGLDFDDAVFEMLELDEGE